MAPASARPSGAGPVARLGESFEAGVYAQLLLARAVAPAMVQMRTGLIVTVSFDTAGGLSRRRLLRPRQGGGEPADAWQWPRSCNLRRHRARPLAAAMS